MQVREMILSELNDVIELHLEGLELELKMLSRIFPGKSIDYSGREQLSRLLSQVVSSGEGQVFLASDGLTNVGYCLATKKVYPVENPKMCGCINGIYVRDGYKRKGLGTQLFDEAVKWLRREGVSYLELYHMINDPRATAFWQKMGFTQVQLNCAKQI